MDKIITVPAFKVLGGQTPTELEQKLNKWLDEMDEEPGFKIRRTQLAQSGQLLTALINYETEDVEEDEPEERSATE